MADLLDVAYPPADPAQLVADAQALGARAVGLYVVNWSAPTAAVSGAYARAVAARGLGVLPIITPGQTPGPVSAVMAALGAWWVGDGTPVASDIEQPGVDTPAPSWEDQLIRALLGGGYQSWIYENASTRTAYPWGDWWEADWTFATHLDQGTVATQFTDRLVGPSGTRYDGSSVKAGIRFHGDAVRRIEMVILEANDGSGAQWLHNGGVRHIDIGESAALVGAGVPVQMTDPAVIARIPRASEAPLLWRNAADGAVYAPIPPWRHIAGGEYAALLGENAEVENVDQATIDGVPKA